MRLECHIAVENQILCEEDFKSFGITSGIQDLSAFTDKKNITMTEETTILLFRDL